MSIRKRTWKTKGVTRTRWIHDFTHPVTGERMQEVIRDHLGKPVTSRAAAERIASMQYAAAVEVAAGRGAESADDIVTLKELLDYYRARPGLAEASQRIDRVQANHLVRVLGDIKISMLTLPVLEEYTKHRQQEYTGEFTRKHVSGTTVKKELTLLRGAMRYAARRNKISISIPAMPEIVTEDYVPRCLTRDEMNALLKACGDDDSELRQLVEITYLTGLRRAEIYRLTWEEVDFKNSLIRFRTHKRGGSSTKPMTTVYLSSRAVELFQRRYHWCVKHQPRNSLVFGVSRYRVDGVATTVDPRITTKIRSAARRAKIDRPRQVGMHALRHTCASHMIDAGATIPEAAAHLRHRDGGQLLLQRYAHVHEAGLRKVLQQICNKNRDENKET